MSRWHWVVRGPEGAELSSSEEMYSREDAEAWMGGEWESLLAAGGESVTLVCDGRELYTMGLRSA